MQKLFSQVLNPNPALAAPRPDPPKATINPNLGQKSEQNRKRGAPTASLPENSFPINNAPQDFYFQQRRGKLDIRSISRIDIPKIVRSSDVEALQVQI